MAVEAGPGPERERYALEPRETEAFVALVGMSTYNTERLQLSNALRNISNSQGPQVTDAFLRCAAKMWR